LVDNDFPTGENEWQIVLSSKKLLDWGAKYGLAIVGMDSRWKNTDLKRPLTILVAVCRGKGFPIAVMVSERATAKDFSKFLDITALEIEQRTGLDWDPITMIDKDNAEKNGVKSRRTYGRKVIIPCLTSL
jgi:hypothetical protein